MATDRYLGIVQVLSFGYGHAPAPEAHITLDLRHHFRDPHVDPSLRSLTGRHAKVRRAVLGTPGIDRLLRATVGQVQALNSGPSRGPVTVAVGCVGGRHRSAVAAAQLARRLTRRGYAVSLVHRDIDRPIIVRPVKGES